MDYISTWLKRWRLWLRFNTSSTYVANFSVRTDCEQAFMRVRGAYGLRHVSAPMSTSKDASADR